jgi:hypothetical protein
MRWCQELSPVGIDAAEVPCVVVSHRAAKFLNPAKLDSARPRLLLVTRQKIGDRGERPYRPLQVLGRGFARGQRQPFGRRQNDDNRR